MNGVARTSTVSSSALVGAVSAGAAPACSTSVTPRVASWARSAADTGSVPSATTRTGRVRSGASITLSHGLVADAKVNTRAAWVVAASHSSYTVDSGWPSRA